MSRRSGTVPGLLGAGGCCKASMHPRDRISYFVAARGVHRAAKRRRACGRRGVGDVAQRRRGAPSVAPARRQLGDVRWATRGAAATSGESPDSVSLRFAQRIRVSLHRASARAISQRIVGFARPSPGRRSGSNWRCGPRAAATTWRLGGGHLAWSNTRTGGAFRVPRIDAYCTTWAPPTPEPEYSISEQ